METPKSLTRNFGKLILFEGKKPVIHESVFVAAGSKIIGDVIIDEHSNIWYNTVIRGDVNFIRIGRSTNIQDGCILHVSSGPNPLIIGSYITVGHGAILHSCIVEDYSLVGMGSTVLDGAIVRKNSMVAAGSLIRAGFEVPSGKLAGGVPAKIIRDLRPEEIDYFSISAENYVTYARQSFLSINGKS